MNQAQGYTLVQQLPTHELFSHLNAIPSNADRTCTLKMGYSREHETWKNAKRELPEVVTGQGGAGFVMLKRRGRDPD